MNTIGNRVFLLFIAIASLATSAFGLSESPIPIRVCVVDNADRIVLVVTGPHTIYPLRSDEAVKSGRFFRAEVRATKGGIMVGNDELKAGGITIKASRDATIFVDGRRFRGYIDIVRTESSRLLAVNHLDMESYLYGVLYHEVSHLWPIEVLKAQAIAARTFALYQIRQNKNKDYDVRSDIYSQVYGGRSSERKMTTRAVNLTRGQVLTYNGALFPAYYHATCGGRTEDASVLWNIDIPPLKGGPCPWCKDSPHYRWSKAIPLEEVRGGLIAAGYKLEEICSITAMSRDASERVEKLEVRDAAGAITIVAAKDFRLVLDPNIVRSTNFEVGLRGGHAFFKGYGWGHGVGMCQWGAYGMAKAGKKTKEILSYYYPGARISAVSTIADNV